MVGAIRLLSRLPLALSPWSNARAQASSSGTDCCRALDQALPEFVHFQSSPEYSTRHETYYSLQQQLLFPACTVKPLTAEHVSVAIKTARANECAFAVASGGHMSWPQSSNINDGFVLDLRGLQQIDIAADASAVKLGPGSTWQSVYAAMTPHNITTTGARINDVGVGGFLLGGGIAFASVTKGFGSMSVYNYEVVLANGTITNVNADTHPDLFWALKLPGTNLGIVTRFDMHTYPSRSIWGAIRIWPFSDTIAHPILNDFTSLTLDVTNTDTHKAVVFIHTYPSLDHTLSTSLLTVPVSMSTPPKPIPPPTALTHTPPIFTDSLAGPTHDVVNQVIAGALESSARTQWHTFTVRASASNDFWLAIRERGKELFAPYAHHEGLQWTLNLQSLQRSYIEASKGAPGYEKLSESGEDLVFVLLIATWSHPTSDTTLSRTLTSLGSWAESHARQHGILNDFIYLNYADGKQRVFERSLSGGEMARMQTVRRDVDPEGIFAEGETGLWRGGFKLPGEEVGGVGQEEGEGVGMGMGMLKEL